jgi:hypothetical protein
MNEEFTGDGVVSSEAVFPAAGWVRNTHVSDVRCLAYDVPREKSAVERTVRQMLPGRPNSAQPREAPTERPDRFALRQHLARANHLAARLADASQRDDPMEQAIVGSDLSDSLQALWKLRSLREQEWAEVVNFLQSALAQEEFERFTPGHCRAVRQVLADFLAGGAVDPEDVIRARLILREAGFDPWKAVAALDE